jgi:membrane fusion protein, multidrug efflux system
MLRALMLLLLLSLASCADTMDEAEGDSAGDDDDSAAEVAKATPVKVASVEPGSIAQTIASSATVDAEERADILVEVSGTVETLSAEEGDAVVAGSVLATLKNPMLKGELQRAEATFNRAGEEFDAIKGLMDQGFVARNDYDEAAHAFDTARLTFEQARESHAARELRSPIRGTISSRQIRYGEAVTPGRLAFQVVDLDRLRVEVNLPEKDLARLRTGQRARIRSEVLDGIETAGRLQRISPVVDPATGTVKVTVAIERGDSPLRPGMFVNVDLVVDTHDQALLLPKRAIVYDEGEPLAFVISGETAVRTPLTLGFTDRDRVEVLSGVSAGDQVVIVGQSLLRDGAEVRVVE